MRILHIITTLDLGGAERQLLLLVAEQKSKGLNPLVVFLKGEGILKNHFLGQEIPVKKISDEGSAVFPYCNLRRLIREFNPDVVHAHLPVAQLVSALINRSVPLVLTRHDQDKFYPKGKKWLSRLLWGFVKSRSSKIIAISSAVLSSMRSNHEISDSDSVEIVHYGFPASERPSLENRRVLRNMFGISDDELVIGTIGRFIEVKSQRDLVEVLAFLRNELKIKLVLIGYGELEGNLMNAAEALSVEDLVIWPHSSVDSNKMIEALDIFVLPSKSEGFGLVLLEAMSKGLPLIGSNSGAIPEVIGDAGIIFRTGNVLELAEAIKRMIPDRARLTFGEKSYKRLNCFDIKLKERKINEIYESAVSGNSGRI